MRPSIVHITVTVALVGLFSCQKEKKSTATPPSGTPPVIPPVTPTYDDYTALKPGDYWIYQDYRLDSINGAAHPLNMFDSTYVEKDTIISGKTYHKYMDLAFLSGPNSYNTYFLRDSLSYVVDQTGRIFFSSIDFVNIFRTYYSYPGLAHPDTIRVTEQMGFKDASVTVNAGTFVTRTFRQVWHLPLSLPYGPTREYDCMYAKGIGVVRRTSGFYTITPDIYERRLERYHLQ